MVRFFVLLILLWAYVDCYAQDFFPLEVGNLWSYQTSDDSGNVSYRNLEVVGDSLFPNGKVYHILSYEDVTHGRYARVDSGFIIFRTSHDVGLYKIDAQVLEQWNVDWGPIGYVWLDAVDTVQMFGATTLLYKYILDGLVTAHAWFSPDFGPVYGADYGDPAPPWPLYSWQLIGCVLGDSTYGTVVNIDSEPIGPRQFVLEQNYPNPFNPVTTIGFLLPNPGRVSLEVFDLLGRHVLTLSDRYFAQGRHQVRFDGSGLASGVYVYVLRQGDVNKVKKMLLLK